MSFYELYSTATPLLLPSAEWMYRLPGDLFGSLLLITMKGLADQRRPLSGFTCAASSLWASVPGSGIGGLSQWQGLDDTAK